MGLFERYLTVWVALGIAAGVGLGLLAPTAFEGIAALQEALRRAPSDERTHLALADALVAQKRY